MVAARDERLGGARHQPRGGASRPRRPGLVAHGVKGGAAGGAGRSQCRGTRGPRSIFGLGGPGRKSWSTASDKVFGTHRVPGRCPTSPGEPYTTAAARPLLARLVLLVFPPFQARVHSPPPFLSLSQPLA